MVAWLVWPSAMAVMTEWDNARSGKGPFRTAWTRNAVAGSAIPKPGGGSKIERPDDDVERGGFACQTDRSRQTLAMLNLLTRDTNRIVRGERVPQAQ